MSWFDLPFRLRPENWKSSRNECPTYGKPSDEQLAHALFILEHIHDYLEGSARQLLIAKFLDDIREVKPGE